MRVTALLLARTLSMPPQMFRTASSSSRAATYSRV
jgi:hypothetical protein